MRLTATEAGFVDATPIKPGKLVDFVMVSEGFTDALLLAEAFWTTHRSTPERAKLVAAAVHALFLGQNPQHPQFERFLLLYGLRRMFRTRQSCEEADRSYSTCWPREWMCQVFGMPVPAWADPASGAEIAALRNETVHETLFVGEPLGFAVHGTGTNQNPTLEMQALICRLIVALLGAENCDYVRSQVNTRQRNKLALS